MRLRLGQIGCSDRTVTTYLTTERMLVRRFSDLDLDWLAEQHRDPAVMRYIDDGRPVSLVVVAAERLPAILRHYAEPPDGPRVLRSDREIRRRAAWLVRTQAATQHRA